MPDDWNAWIHAEALASALGGADAPVVLDARFALADPGAGETQWREARIPGARYAHLDRDLSDHRKTGQGRHPWPDADAFAARLGRWGIGPETRVAIYDAGDGALAAARAWFLLRAMGHRRVAVLDGGWARWRSLGLPVETGEAGMPADAGPYPGAFDTSRLLDADALATHLAGGGLLVDARAPERFRGDVEPIDRVGGHVPGAVNRPYARNVEDGLARPREALRREFAALLGDSAPGDAVVMCGSGVTACHHLLAMEHAGLPGAKLFTGSWSGWIDDPARPVATGDAR